MKTRLKKQKWTAGKCCVAECPMTLVLHVGAERRICWLHALAYGLPLALLAATAACSGDVFTSRDSAIGADSADVANEGGNLLDSGSDTDARADVDADAATATDADASASDACATVYGATACNSIMATYCQALYTCNGGMTQQQCIAWFASNYPNDYDCAAQKYKKSVCAAEPSNCTGVVIPTAGCGKLMSNYPAALGAGCTTFFGAF